MGDDAVRQSMAVLHEHHIASYQFPEQAARAVGALWQAAEVRGQRSEVREIRLVQEVQPVREPEEHKPTLKVSNYLAEALQQGRSELGEAESRPILAVYGVPQPRAEIAPTAGEAARLAAAMGFPVALKIVSPDIFHKSEVGGIALKLADEGAVRRAYDAMLANVRQRRPDAVIAGVLVAEMAPPGYELIVGMRRDRQFGPLLMVGLGGIYVELLKDVAFRVAPFDSAQARRMLGETQAGKLLSGLRGQPPADVDAVVDVILRVAKLALDYPQIQEIDVNPLMAYPAGTTPGALAVDVRMVLG
jgi:acetyltransferase